MKRMCSRFVRGRLWPAFLGLSLTLNRALANATGGEGGGDIASSQLAKGTEKLIDDVTKWLMFPIVPGITVLAIIYYLVRRSMADEMDHRRWNGRITAAIISCIVAIAASALINVLVGYYKAG